MRNRRPASGGGCIIETVKQYQDRHHKPRPRIYATVLLVVIATVLAGSGCVYFNTFYNARKAFKSAEATYHGEADSRRGPRINTAEYRQAIDKSLKVIENYPNSKYVDDALYVVGVSYFRLGEYIRAERRIRELLASYPESEYAKQVTLYLAQSKLEIGEQEDAMVLFKEIFEKDYAKKVKSEAALALGDYYHDAEDYERSRSYYRAVRDSLGAQAGIIRSQRAIADSYFETYEFGEALGAYLQLLGLDPGLDDRYHALFQAAQCSYRMLRVEDGLDYLTELATDDVYFDSLGVLKMKIAEGYEIADDLALAEATYDEIVAEVTKSYLVAEAYYRLGLIYQYEYDDLDQAKKFYDEAVTANRASDAGTLALQKSSDIGKLDVYARSEALDTSATQEMIDRAAKTQYLLAELYWFQLNKPDSAMKEMEYLLEAFPDSRVAPEALIALGDMHRDYLLDTITGDSLFRRVLTEYPRSDYVAEALDILGLRGSAADTGYAQKYFSKAEDFLADEGNYDSAIYYYQYVADNFPDSRYYEHARLAILYVEELYSLPGDSSLIYAYNEFRDSFPESRWAGIAAQRVGQKAAPQFATYGEEEGEEPNGERDDEFVSLADTGYGEDIGSVTDIELSRYRRPNGDTVILLDEEPILIEEPFEFPTEAYSMEQDEIWLYYHILLDFSGKVIEYELRYPSQYDQLNTNANRTVASMTFDALEVSRLVDLYGIKEDPSGPYHWFLYKYVVEKPEVLR